MTTYAKALRCLWLSQHSATRQEARYWACRATYHGRQAAKKGEER